MKRILCFVLAGCLWACEGPAGPMGPQGFSGSRGLEGAKGDTGATGAAGKDGVNGKDGKDAVQPKIYDFNLDISKALASYKWPVALTANDVVMVYINRGSSYSPLPYKGYCSTTDNLGFEKLDASFEAWETRLYIDNETIISAGSTFNFRAVILKGIKAGRIKAMPYEELAKLYNL